MKSEKITEPRRAARGRWYDDACGTAFALEMIGERWSILIMRELMFGPRRFSELRAGLPGISANILTQRLSSLESKSIARRRTLPPPASAQVYELTRWGYEAEPLVQMLGKWATRHPEHDPTLPLSAASIMMSFLTMFDAKAAAGFAARIGFRFEPDTFVLTIADGEIAVERAEPVDTAMVVSTDPMVLAAIVYGGAPIETYEASGELELAGDRDLFGRFPSLFALPEKIEPGRQ